MKNKLLFQLLNFWPPFLGAGVSVRVMRQDFMHLRVRLKRRFWNRNLVGVQFGGSIYAMTDPFYMIMLIVALGPDYIVWDKSASIRFRKPGKTELFCEFILTPEDLADIRERMKSTLKYDWERDVLVRDSEGQIIAEVKKVVQIRKKAPG